MSLQDIPTEHLSSFEKPHTRERQIRTVSFSTIVTREGKNYVATVYPYNKEVVISDYPEEGSSKLERLEISDKNARMLAQSLFRVDFSEMRF
jgi:hypothetical protein